MSSYARHCKPTHGGESEDEMKFLTYDDLKPESGIDVSKTTLWRWEKEGQFPRRVRIGASYGWPETEIDDWIKAKIDARDAEAI
jgi:prophage regulatory protein